MHVIETAFDAYWFMYNHPNAVDKHPDHPFINVDEYEFKGFGKGLFGSRKGKPRDAEYDLAYQQKRVQMYWDGQFINNLDIYYTKVNPLTNRIEDDTTLNTKVVVWLESGPAMWEDYTNEYIGNTHDYLLDCGGDTFEEALIKLANNVKEKYGDYDDATD